MLRWTRPFSGRAVLASVLAITTITTAGAATYHRLAVTTSSGGGSGGALEVLQTSATGGAVQGEVAASPDTHFKFPFGLFGIYDSSSSSSSPFTVGLVGTSSNGYGVAGASQGSNAGVFAYEQGPQFALSADAAQSTSPTIFAETANGASADAIDSVLSGSNSNGDEVAINGQDQTDANNLNGGVLGTSKGDSYGVSGVALNGQVSNLNQYAVTGSANGSSVSYGVIGYSDVGTGLRATSGSYLGLSGFSDNNITGSFMQETLATPSPFVYSENGVNAVAQNGAGVYSSSALDPAIAAEMGCNAYLNNVSETSQNCSGLFVQEDGTAGYPLMAYEPSSTISAQSCFQPLYPFFVDSAGDMVECGVTVSSNVYQRSSNPASDAVTYAPRQTESTVEDFGRARLVNGSATVALAPDFKQTIDATSPYMVFTMPHGDSRRLYLASQSPSGFVIRESRGGRSTVDFDYRIVARPYGKRLARLPHESQIVAHYPIDRPSQRTSYAQVLAAARARDRALSPDSKSLLLKKLLSTRGKGYVPPPIPANFMTR